MLEIIIGIIFYVLLALAVFFFYLCVKNPDIKYWALFIPAFIILLYIPYEAYFVIKEVSLSVPIRVDLLFIFPLFEAVFALAAFKWYMKTKKNYNFINLIMTVFMISCVVAWPTYFVVYFYL